MSQAEWTSGYVTDLDYEAGFFRELSPGWIDLALALRSLRGPAAGSASDKRAFSYCELGCGHGLSILVLAAANPAARFFANDFNPAHIASAKRLAQAAGLENLTFSDQSFDEYKSADLPELDYVGLHGVYSWISADNRRHVGELIRRKLSPGGVVYVSYNSLPGRNAALPLRRLLTDHASLSQGPTSTRIAAAIKLAERVAALKTGFFAHNPDAVRRLRQMQGESMNYLAHEYFNRDWNPQYFAEVVAELAEAKLVFATSADITDPLERPGAEAGQQLLDEATDPVFRETLRDFLLDSGFRRDLFVKGLSRQPGWEQRESLLRLRFALTRVHHEPLTQAKIAGQTLALKQEIYAPLIAALANGPATFQQLIELPDLALLGPARDPLTLQALVVLVSLDEAVVCTRDGGEATARPFTDRLNRALLEEAETQDRTHALSSPVAGGGVSVTWLEQLFLGALSKNIDPVAHVRAKLARLGRRLTKQGSTLTKDAEHDAAIEERFRNFMTRRVPALTHLGVM